MNNVNSGTSASSSTSFVSRVLDNDSLKKGIAAAAAGTLIAIITEALWSSKS